MQAPTNFAEGYQAYLAQVRRLVASPPTLLLSLGS